MEFSLSQELSISMQNSTINQPKNYGFHSVQNSLSTNSINQQKHPKVMEFLSRTFSWYKFQPTQKAQQLWNSLQNSLSTNYNQPKNPKIMEFSQDLSLSQCKLRKSIKNKPKNKKNKKIVEFLSELSQCRFYKHPTQKAQNGKEKKLTLNLTYCFLLLLLFTQTFL